MMIINQTDESIRIKTSEQDEIYLESKGVIELDRVYNLDEIRGKVVIIGGTGDEFLS